MSLASIVRDIGEGKDIAESRIVGLLFAQSRSDRFSVCRELAAAFAASGRRDMALRLSRRACGLWVGEPGFIDGHLALLREVRDAEGIRAAAKRAGMLCVEKRDVMGAVRYFNAHHYAHQSTGGGDRYEYDHDILHAIELLAGVSLGGRLPRRQASKGGKIRVAYLVYGANHTVSALVRLMLDFARHHDRERFEIAFFSPDAKVPTRDANAELLHAAGSDLIMADSVNDLVCLKATAKALDRFAPDVLVSVAALADYRQYYLFAGCPAVLRVSFIYGPPPQFVPPTTDWVISGTRHPLIDSPCSGSFIEIEVTLPESGDMEGASLPCEVSIPNGCVVIMAAGRSEKFLDRGYWSAIVQVLETYPKAIFIAFGLIERPDFLEDILATSAGKRIQILGWQEDHRALLSRADIFVDTYPSGGGLTIMDSMVFGIPVLAFSNDYLVPFDQTTWNPAEEIIGIPELIVPRGDFADFLSRLGRLIADPALRRRLGDECRRHVYETRGNPDRMLRRIESEYLYLWKMRASLGELAASASETRNTVAQARAWMRRFKSLCSRLFG